LEYDHTARRLCRVMLPVLAVMVPLVWATAYDDVTHKESVLADVSAFYVALALFLFCVHRRAFTSKPWVYLGGISYSLYLFHPLTLDLAAFWAKTFAWPVSGVVQVLASLSLSLLVAHIVNRHVERPAIRLGKRLVPALLNLRRGGRKVAAP
jgi:peptidoglycan/LPS O-acetylase OafA/YrhL